MCTEDKWGDDLTCWLPAQETPLKMVGKEGEGTPCRASEDRSGQG